MQYMLLIYGSDDAWASQSPDDMAREMGAYMAYSEALAKAGKMVRGDELQPSVTARSVTVRGGAEHVADGPYVDTKEQLGGYYLIEADSEEDAIAWAKKCPGARHGGVEVRPVVMR